MYAQFQRDNIKKYNYDVLDILYIIENILYIIWIYYKIGEK